jgi:hypothetical protein
LGNLYKKNLFTKYSFLSIILLQGGVLMDIAKVSMALAQTQTLSNVGIAVLDKTMESSEVLGQGIMKMMDAAAMERSVNPAVGSNFDMLV